MKSAIKLPTEHEISEAWNAIAESEPVPLAQYCDHHPSMVAFVDRLTHESRGGNIREWLKAAFVGGLHLGIRIGELRGRYLPGSGSAH
jgi:hypothetical protein